MNLAIMQPYFFPYIGYFQLFNLVDEFVIYDNIQYTKKGWINRNRILNNSKDDFITIPIKKDSDFLNINQRYLADTWILDRKKILNRIVESYKRAPNFNQVFSLFEKCIISEKVNLFDFLLNSLVETNNYLEISTKFTLSSTLDIDHSLKSQEKVLAICKYLNASEYTNPIGGLNLYSKSKFQENSIKLQFHRSNLIQYQQFTNDYLPWLSIIDVMMFNSKSDIIDFIHAYSLE
jgi:hypothetical protein